MTNIDRIQSVLNKEVSLENAFKDILVKEITKVMVIADYKTLSAVKDLVDNYNEEESANQIIEILSSQQEQEEVKFKSIREKLFGEANVDNIIDMMTSTINKKYSVNKPLKEFIEGSQDQPKGLELKKVTEEVKCKDEQKVINDDDLLLDPNAEPTSEHFKKLNRKTRRTIVKRIRDMVKEAIAENNLDYAKIITEIFGNNPYNINKKLVFHICKEELYNYKSKMSYEKDNNETSYDEK